MGKHAMANGGCSKINSSVPTKSGMVQQSRGVKVLLPSAVGLRSIYSGTDASTAESCMQVSQSVRGVHPTCGPLHSATPCRMTLSPLRPEMGKTNRVLMADARIGIRPQQLHRPRMNAIIKQ